MDLAKLGRLMIGGGVTGLFCALVAPLNVWHPLAGIAGIFAVQLACIGTIGAFLAPSPAPVLAHTPRPSSDPDAAA